MLDSVCGSPANLNAYYNTSKYNIYICNSPEGYIYIGNEKGTNNTVVSASVTATANGFVATNEGYDYHIDGEALQVFAEASTQPILVEAVEVAERY